MAFPSFSFPLDRILSDIPKKRPSRDGLGTGNKNAEEGKEKRRNVENETKRVLSGHRKKKRVQ